MERLLGQFGNGPFGFCGFVAGHHRRRRLVFGAAFLTNKIAQAGTFHQDPEIGITGIGKEINLWLQGRQGYFNEHGGSVHIYHQGLSDHGIKNSEAVVLERSLANRAAGKTGWNAFPWD